MNKILSRNFGRSVASHMRSKGLSNRALAKAVGISETAVRRIVGGTLTVPTPSMEAVAKYFNTDTLMNQWNKISSSSTVFTPVTASFSSYTKLNAAAKKLGVTPEALTQTLSTYSTN